MDRTTPPSTRSAAPFVAEARGLHTLATIDATSSGLVKRFSRKDRGSELKNSSTAASLPGAIGDHGGPTAPTTRPVRPINESHGENSRGR